MAGELPAVLRVRVERSSVIAQTPPCERHEDVLERRRVRAEIRQRNPAGLERVEQQRDRLVGGTYLQRPRPASSARGLYAAERGERRLVDLSGAVDAELDDVTRSERRYQLAW